MYFSFFYDKMEHKQKEEEEQDRDPVFDAVCKNESLKTAKCYRL
jgi:uncharacterized membrane protein YkgB